MESCTSTVRANGSDKLKEQDEAPHLHETQEVDILQRESLVKVIRIYQLHRLLPLYRDGCSCILLEMEEGLRRLEGPGAVPHTDLSDKEKLVVLLEETHLKFDGFVKEKSKGIVDMLAERESTLQDMRDLHKAWRKINSGRSTVSALPDILIMSDVDRLGLVAHLRTLLGNASHSTHIRKSLKRLRGKSAQSFIELLEEVLSDTSEDDSLRTRCDRALRYVCKSSGLLPKSLTISESLKTLNDHPLCGGGFADVWQGELGGQKVAIKAIRFFNQDAQASAKFRKSFLQEALLWRNLNHRNVLPFLGVNTTLFRLCIVSPWMYQGNVNEYLKRKSDTNRLILLVGIARGLTYLHDRKPDVIHGDLKGVNILIDNIGEPKLCDFGLARIALDAHSSNVMTDTSTTNGSLRWMAPELIQPTEFGLEKAMPNAKTDIYAFGCVCLEILTGKPPFSQHRSDAIVLFEVVKGLRPPRPPRHVTQRGLTDDVWSLIEKCWHSKPDSRPMISVCLSELERSAANFSQVLHVDDDSMTVTSKQTESYSDSGSSIVSMLQHNGQPMGTELSDNMGVNELPVLTNSLVSLLSALDESLRKRDGETSATSDSNNPDTPACSFLADNFHGQTSPYNSPSTSTVFTSLNQGLQDSHSVQSLAPSGKPLRKNPRQEDIRNPPALDSEYPDARHIFPDDLRGQTVPFYSPSSSPNPNSPGNISCPPSPTLSMRSSVNFVTSVALRDNAPDQMSGTKDQVLGDRRRRDWSTSWSTFNTYWSHDVRGRRSPYYAVRTEPTIHNPTEEEIIGNTDVESDPAEPLPSINGSAQRRRSGRLNLNGSTEVGRVESVLKGTDDEKGKPKSRLKKTVLYLKKKMFT